MSNIEYDKYWHVTHVYLFISVRVTGSIGLGFTKGAGVGPKSIEPISVQS
jgi:hypothetical protein